MNGYEPAGITAFYGALKENTTNPVLRFASDDMCCRCFHYAILLFLLLSLSAEKR